MAVRGLGGATSIKTPAVATTVVADDVDGDGFSATEDCDDLDPTVFPGAVERCDGVDNDCDGAVEPDGQILVEGLYAYDDLQQAVDVAQTGGFVELCSGTITVPSAVTISRGVTLRGQGPGVTVLDGDGEPQMFWITGDDVTLEGFTVTGLDPDTNRSEQAVYYTYQTSRGVVRDLEFTGIGVASLSLSGDSHRVVDTVIHHTTPDRSPVDVGGSMVFERVVVRDNQAPNADAAIRIYGPGLVQATDLVLHANTVRNAALVLSSGTDLECTGCDLGVGPTDNAPADIRLATSNTPAVYADYWDDETFHCDVYRSTVNYNVYGSCARGLP
jgi:hypothetical protein